ncbi:unnamed protein product [Diabrotica balteata]|uniref:Regulatory protein zeste n=1 Tax=Diabrotica balteata TaxID=107213 RepID=A0A9N9X7Z4_DIABA|nr:unnamed protein product [Diabrotica balteata]
MATPSKKKISVEQLNYMVDFITKNKILLHRKTKPSEANNKLVEKLWNELTLALNAIGCGPSKLKLQWKKTFIDWKSYTKKKTRDVIRAKNKTGGGGEADSKILTPVEEKLMTALSYITVTGADTLTDWKCKTKAKAVSLRKAQQKTGAGSPQQPLLSTLENRLLSIMGVTAVIGNESVFELGFGENQVDETPTNQPSTSRANSERDGGSNKSVKRKLDHQNNTGTSNKKPFRRRPMAVPLSNELLDLNRQSVELLQNVSNNTDNMAISLESIATSLKIMAEILKNSGSSHVNPSSINTLDNNTNDDRSGSDFSSTTSEDVTTGESNYSPSVSDAKSTSSESQVSLSSRISNILNEDKENAKEVNKDKKPRKRKCDKSTWKKNLAKKLKDQGKAYVSSTTNKSMKERTMGPPCKNTCRLKCHLSIPNETRERIFQEHWGLGDNNKQRDFISSCIVAIKPKYQYHVHENKRRDNNAFYFTFNETRIKACKTFFKSTLNITEY